MNIPKAAFSAQVDAFFKGIHIWLSLTQIMPLINNMGLTIPSNAKKYPAMYIF